ncbi:MAG: phosphopyruvate hydratase [Chloroflexota bacterium]|nr:phosphopyruvate hydratase [Chloroflexota bacterium]
MRSDTAIADLHAVEILDSRGRPTVQTSCRLAGGAMATVSVPSGASTGAAEAHELRDLDPARYGGLGCRTAVANVNGEVLTALTGADAADQAAIDQALLDLDGTENKARLGANAILSVSLAVARASAIAAGRPLYERFAEIAGLDTAVDRLSRPTVNLFSGGKHAGGQIPIQDVLITSLADTADVAMEQIVAVFNAAAALCREKYGMRTLVADEGGLAPDFASVDAAFEDAIAAVERAGLRPGEEIAICLDVASSHFFADGRYHIDGQALTAEGMIDVIDRWLDRWPIVSVEDGLAEDDWEHWPALRERIAGRALVLGDDFLTTNPARIRRAIDTGAANALLLKVNQIGTLTEAAEALRLARDAGWAVVVSARSGETEDDWLTDLATGWRGDQLKVGSVTRSERLAKWNRLLTLADATGLSLAPWPKAT